MSKKNGGRDGEQNCRFSQTTEDRRSRTIPGGRMKTIKFISERDATLRIPDLAISSLLVSAPYHKAQGSAPFTDSKRFPTCIKLWISNFICLFNRMPWKSLILNHKQLFPRSTNYIILIIELVVHVFGKVSRLRRQIFHQVSQLFHPHIFWRAIFC